MALADLITSGFATQALAAGGITLTAAQTTHLASAIASASRLIRRWCGDRDFTRTTYTREFTPDLSGLVFLDQFPVNKVTRIAGGRTQALTIRAAATNQRATVGYATTGDFDSGLTVTGLTLTRVASGTTTSNTLLFATYPTLDSLVTAINLLSTWSATAASGYGSWPSAELVGGEVSRGALAGAAFDLYAEDLDGHLDPSTGMLRVTSPWRGGIGSAWGNGWIDDDDRALSSALRITFDAGFDAIPADVQEACAETVGDMLRGLATDSRLSSESVGNRSQVYNVVFADYALTKNVMGKLAPWRIVRA